MSQEDDKILENVITGGILGAGLTALLKDRNVNNADIALGALLGAVILASVNAKKKAKEYNQDVLVRKGDNLYRKTPDGREIFIRRLPPRKLNLPLEYDLS
ncbi:hypothetical protein [Leptospira kirschneri]|uniref:Glycine zipper 2TM domain protein n=2 Tax=Leptospira kirschneri TaxID=29507 RepID=A0A0E2B3W8_9LEPT|nr:hypothetical protein [Leptospira kirschneri]EKO15497.1 hypothetical protein LEP1GSC081_0642 [Leptospira kirschneri str. H1]EMK21749.1 hypothetical protein LEP1GSC008_3284 [Leptospira kirschneri serovar Bulgarica str. Nikolaevo]UML81913.1 hypothetical protein FH602_10230 [Leptospira kirschneri]